MAGLKMLMVSEPARAEPRVGWRQDWGVLRPRPGPWIGSACPGTKIMGGKVMSGKTKRVVIRAAQALRLAAAVLTHGQTQRSGLPCGRTTSRGLRN